MTATIRNTHISEIFSLSYAETLLLFMKSKRIDKISRNLKERNRRLQKYYCNVDKGGCNSGSSWNKSKINSIPGSSHIGKLKNLITFGFIANKS